MQLSLQGSMAVNMLDPRKGTRLLSQKAAIWRQHQAFRAQAPTMQNPCTSTLKFCGVSSLRSGIPETSYSTAIWPCRLSSSSLRLGLHVVQTDLQILLLLLIEFCMWVYCVYDKPSSDSQAHE